jgi:hypothetical protein
VSRAVRIAVAVITLIELLAAKGSAQNSFQPPTATEVFHLRSECAVLAQKLLDADIVWFRVL